MKSENRSAIAYTRKLKINLCELRPHALVESGGTGDLKGEDTKL